MHRWQEPLLFSLATLRLVVQDLVAYLDFGKTTLCAGMTINKGHPKTCSGGRRRQLYFYASGLFAVKYSSD